MTASSWVGSSTVLLICLKFECNVQDQLTNWIVLKKPDGNFSSVTGKTAMYICVNVCIYTHSHIYTHIHDTHHWCLSSPPHASSFVRSLAQWHLTDLPGVWVRPPEALVLLLPQAIQNTNSCTQIMMHVLSKLERVCSQTQQCQLRCI